MTMFSIMPIEVFSDRRLTLQHIRVLGTLLSFRAKNTNVVWPSRNEIAARCGMHPSNISAATSDLVKLGWIEKDGKGGFSKASRYKITVPELETTLVDSTTVVGKTTVVESTTVDMTNTLVEPTTVADSTTVVDSTTSTLVESTTRMPLVDSTTRKEQTSEQTSEQTRFAESEKPASAPRKKNQLSEATKEACSLTWKAYCAGYKTRYRIEPVKNAKVAGQVVSFVGRVPQADAPLIAEWFLSHKSPYYVSRGHSVDCLLKDAEKLRTEWATGRMMDEKRPSQNWHDRQAETIAILTGRNKPKESERDITGEARRVA